MARTKITTEIRAKIKKAADWLNDEGKGERPVVAARIEGIEQYTDAVRKAAKRAQYKTRNSSSKYNRHGGNNQILSIEQEQSVHNYISDNARPGQLGATKAMIRSIIIYLLEQESPPRPPPSKSWFSSWFNKQETDQRLCTIHTKPMERARLETHSEDDNKDWFARVRADMKARRIKNKRRIINMDESSARVGCPNSEEVVVPWEVEELYTASPENRKSVTIIETIRADGTHFPAYIIPPGIECMENWIQPDLNDDDMIFPTPTGYTSNIVIMDYLKFLVKHADAGPDKPWTALFCDGHSTHEYEEFAIEAAKHNIIIYIFPSHETHAMQPLDANCFRTWKKEQNKVILAGLRAFDYDYSVTSFFRDLSTVRKNTFKPHTIIRAFEIAGIWPMSCKQTLRTRRELTGKRQRSQKKQSRQQALWDSEPDLPKLLPKSYYEAGTAITEMLERGVIGPASSPYRERFTESLSITKGFLTQAILLQDDFKNLQSKVQNELWKKTTSRKQISKGGPVNIGEARQRQAQKIAKEQSERIRLVRVRIQKAINQVKKVHKSKGVEARRQMKENKRLYNNAIKERRYASRFLLDPIRQPDVEPTELELEALKPLPDLLQELFEALHEAGLPEVYMPLTSLHTTCDTVQNNDNDDTSVDFDLSVAQEPITVISDNEVDPALDITHLERDSSDTGCSIDEEEIIDREFDREDSIMQQADFIHF